MESEGANRLYELKAEIRRLEMSLSQSPDDAFGYLELGCLFAEADQREEAIRAFRASYSHRTGGTAALSGSPVAEQQLREAFEVAVNQAPAAARHRTRTLFETAISQEQKAPSGSSRASMIGGIVAVAMIVLSAMSGTPVPGASHDYWPSYTYQHHAWELPPSTGGYWPSGQKGW